MATLNHGSSVAETAGTPKYAIVHDLRGDDQDPGPDQMLRLGTQGHEGWQVEDADPPRPYTLPVLDLQDMVERLLGAL